MFALPEKRNSDEKQNFLSSLFLRFLFAFFTLISLVPRQGFGTFTFFLSATLNGTRKSFASITWVSLFFLCQHSLR